MKSLVQRIDDCLRTESEASIRIDLLGEKACYLARSGHIESAQEIGRNIRDSWERDRDAKAMVWVMLIEGLMHYYSEAHLDAIDRIRRSQIISKSMALTRLSQLTSAWLAHLEFNRFGYVEVRKHLFDATQGNWMEHDDVRLRVALVLGDAFLNCQHLRESQYWYEIARHAANRVGDSLALAALMYNRSAHGVNNVIVESILNDVQPERSLLNRYALELDSSERFEGIIGAKTFLRALNLVRVRYLIAVADFRSASNLLNGMAREFLTFPFREYFQVLSILCKLRLSEGCLIDDVDTVLGDIPGIANRMDMDDCLVLLSVGVEIARLSGKIETSIDLNERLTIAKSRYRDCKEDLIRTVAPFLRLGGDAEDGIGSTWSQY